MSSFVLKRNYQLQFPTSFVEIDRDEMEYVDGGAIGVWKAGWWIDTGITVVGAVVGLVGIAGGVREILRRNAKGLIIQATSKALRKAGLSAGGWAVSTMVGMLERFADFSIGVAIAKAWDRIDGYPNDGELDWIG